MIYANVEERDILLRSTFDEWKRKYPVRVHSNSLHEALTSVQDTFDVVYALDKPPKGWTGELAAV